MADEQKNNTQVVAQPDPKAAPQQPSPTEQPDVIRLTKKQYEDEIIAPKNLLNPKFDRKRYERLLQMENVEFLPDDAPPEPSKEESPEHSPEPLKEEKTPEELDALKKQNEYLSRRAEEERKQALERERKLAKENEDYRKAIEAERNKKQKQEPVQQPDNEIQTRRKKILELRQKLAAIPEAEKDDYDPTQKKIKSELSDLLIEQIVALEEKPVTLTGNEQIESLRSELNEQKKFVSEYLENKKKEDSKELAERQRQQFIKDVQEFQKKRETFKTKKDIVAIDEDYVKFGSRLFEIKTGGTLPTSLADVNNAVADFIAGDPVLVGKAKEAGVVKPEELDTYMEIMEVANIRGGLPSVNGEPATLDDALVYKYQKSGKLTEIMAHERKKGLMMGTNTAASPDTARQLPPNATGNPEELGQEMTEEQAKSNIQTISAVDAYRNPALKRILRKSYERINYDKTGLPSWLAT